MIERSGLATWDPLRLVRAALAGSSDAFAELMRRARPEVLALLRRHDWTAGDVEEVYQEVIVRAFRSLPRLHRAESFRPWLLQITYCASVDWLRRRVVYRRSQRSLDHDPLDPLPLTHGDGADGERCLPVLVEEIARLKPKHAAALLLRGLEGMAYREIAAHLEVSIACAKTYIHRARHWLRSRMALAAAEGWKTLQSAAPLLDPGKEQEP